MKKACLLATAFFILFLGVQGLVVKKFVLKVNRPEPVENQENTYVSVPCEFTPTPTIAWSIIAVGGFLLLYTLSSGK
ncbi:MAG: hypothetical protein Q4D62_09165 [Planctomycetia bacterium]|nr:hypothetical protein [Planctomycetia bacterium]